MWPCPGNPRSHECMAVAQKLVDELDGYVAAEVDRNPVLLIQVVARRDPQGKFLAQRTQTATRFTALAVSSTERRRSSMNGDW